MSDEKPLSTDEFNRLCTLAYLDAQWALHKMDCRLSNPRTQDAVCTCGMHAERAELNRRFQATRHLEGA